ncbi:MAG: DUF5050 domain-containing protein [Ignavibacteriae bacterium]|nr:DUF5050 domain-containing protein [Ignavibacteriota bacterium]
MVVGILKDGFKNIYGSLLFVIISFLIFTGCQDQANTPTPNNNFAEYTQVDFDPAWTLSGERIVYSHSNPDIELSGIYSIDSDGSNNDHIISGLASGPDWSPDASHIVYEQYNDIFISNSNGDSIVNLTSGGRSNDPKWSPDNSFIAYSRVNSLYNSDIYLIRPDGSDNIFIDSNCKYPSWTDDGNSLIYFKQIYENENYTQIGDSLVQYFLINGQKITIAVLQGEEFKFNSYPNLKDDGIIFCSTNENGYAYIYKMDTDGANIIRLTDSQGFSPDCCMNNNKIAYTNRSKGNGRLWIMNNDGNNKTQLTY